MKKARRSLILLFLAAMCSTSHAGMYNPSEGGSGIAVDWWVTAPTSLITFPTNSFASGRTIKSLDGWHWYWAIDETSTGVSSVVTAGVLVTVTTNGAEYTVSQAADAHDTHNDARYLLEANNLSDLVSAATARTNLALVIGTDVLAQQTIGIADNNLLEVDGTPNSTEYARFTANGLEGRTEAEFKADFNLEIGTDVQAWDADLDQFAADGTSYWHNLIAAKVSTNNADWLYLLANTSNWDTAYGWGDHSVEGYHNAGSLTNPTAAKLDDWGTPDDNTDLNATTAHHGLLPKLSGVAGEFFNSNGGWSTPAGGGTGATSIVTAGANVTVATNGSEYTVSQPDGALDGRYYTESEIDGFNFHDAGSLTGALTMAVMLSIDQLGTITTGVWNASVIDEAYLDATMARDVETFTGAVADYEWTTGNVWYVAADASIDIAVANAAAGDTLVLAAGTYTVTDDIDVTKSLCIRGQGVGVTTIQTTTDSINVVKITASDVTIRDFSIDVTASGTLGIYINGAITNVLENVRIGNCRVMLNGHAGLQLSVRVKDSSINFVNSYISAIGLDASDVNAFRCENGATAEADTTAIIQGCTFYADGGGSNSRGAFIYDNGSTDLFVHFRDCSFLSEETTPSTSYGLQGWGSDVYVYADNCTFNGSDYDVFNSSSAFIQLRSCVLVNDTTSGTITYDGTLVTDYMRLQAGTSINEFSTDGTFAGNSDDACPTEKAIKTYGDANWQNAAGSALDTRAATNNVDMSGNQIYGAGSLLTSATNVTINWDTGNMQDIVLGTNVVFAFSNVKTNATYMLRLEQDGTGSRTVTWPATVHWYEGTAPTLSTATGRWDIINFAVWGDTSEISARAGVYWGP